MDFSPNKDYYKILEINQNATPDEIKAAYRKLAKEFHPDLHANNPLLKLANEKFKEVNEAYEVLSDNEKRKSYDAFRTNPVGSEFENTERKSYTEANNHEYKKHTEENYQDDKEKSTHNNKEYEDGEIKQPKNTKVERCQFHKNSHAVEYCEMCEAALCEECSSLFETPICPKCAVENNDLYSKKLIQPLYFGIAAIIIGIITGAFLGIRFNLLKDYGIIEAVGMSVYFYSMALYTWYFYGLVTKYVLKVLYIFFDLFETSEEIAVAIVNLVSIVVGLVVGWAFGATVGTIKMLKDFRRYNEFKDEYKKVKEFINQNYRL